MPKIVYSNWPKKKFSQAIAVYQNWIYDSTKHIHDELCILAKQQCNNTQDITTFFQSSNKLLFKTVQVFFITSNNNKKW